MKIAVCIKRVPDTATRIKVASGGAGIDHTGVEYCISPYDEIAVERAVQLKEAGTATEVIIYCLGSADATKEIRTALAMGADRAVHLVADSEAFDSGGTAAALFAAIEKDCALVMFGNKAVDTDAGQVGARVAAQLGMPFINLVAGLEVAGGVATVSRAVEGASETYHCTLPLAIGAQKGLAEARYPALKGIMAAKKKAIETREVAPPTAQLSTVSLDLPAARAPGRIVGQGVGAVPELVRLLRTEAKVL